MSGRGRGRLGVKKRSLDSPVKPETVNPTRRGRKKVSVRKRVERRKRHGEHARLKPLEPLPEIGVRDGDLAECVFSDDEVSGA